MLTFREILLGALIPIGVSALLAALGLWRRWAFTMPLAAGAAFLTSLALLTGGLPKLPPRDGTDWLFWCAIPLTALGIIDALTKTKLGWLMGLAAGAVVYLITKPLVPHAVTEQTLYITSAAAAIIGAALCFITHHATPRITPLGVLGTLCITLSATSVLVVASNLRIVGVYGLALATALGPIALLSFRTPAAARAVAIVAIPLLAGILAGGVHYPDPGVTWTGAIIVLLAPTLMLAAAYVPTKKNWVRAALAMIAVALAVGAVTGPAALEAKKAAETPDEYTY